MADMSAKIVKTLEHSRQLWTARYSPCGKFLFAAGYDALIHRWDVSTEEPKLLEPITGHSGWTQRMAFVGDNLLTADSWGRLIAWKYAAEKPQPVWNLEQALGGWIRGIAISPDGQTVAVSGNDAAVKLYAVADGKLVGEIGPHPFEVFSVAFHPDGKSLATGDLKGTVRHWDLGTKQVARQIECPALYFLDRIQDSGGARHLNFDSTGKQLLCGGIKAPTGGFAVGAPLLLVIDWDAGKITQELEHEDKNHGYIYDAAYHSTGFVMAATCAMPGMGHLWFWRIGEPKPFFMSKDVSNVRSLSLHPNGTRLAVVTVVAVNGNGKPKGDKYVDGIAKIQLMDLA